MKLTDDEKHHLKQLKNSAGYRVLIMIEEDAKKKLADLLFRSDFTNPEHLRILEKNQTYQQARDDLLKNIESYTREIYTPEGV